MFACVVDVVCCCRSLACLLCANLLVRLRVCLVVWREIRLCGLANIGNCPKAKAARTTRSSRAVSIAGLSSSSCCELLRNFDSPGCEI